MIFLIPLVGYGIVPWRVIQSCYKMPPSLKLAATGYPKMKPDRLPSIPCFKLSLRLFLQLFVVTAVAPPFLCVFRWFASGFFHQPSLGRRFWWICPEYTAPRLRFNELEYAIYTHRKIDMQILASSSSGAFLNLKCFLAPQNIIHSAPRKENSGMYTPKN